MYTITLYLGIWVTFNNTGFAIYCIKNDKANLALATELHASYTYSENLSAKNGAKEDEI